MNRSEMLTKIESILGYAEFGKISSEKRLENILAEISKLKKGVQFLGIESFRRR